MLFEQFIINYGYLSVFVLLFLNGIFGIFPSSKIIYVLAGYYAYSGNLFILLFIFLGALGQTLGNFIQYLIGEKKGLGFSINFLKYLQIKNPKLEIKKLEIVFKKKGAHFLFFGKLTTFKIFISIVAGLTKMNKFIFFIFTFSSSLIFACIWAYIGFFFGKSYEHFGYISIFILFLAILFFYVLYKYMNSEDILKEL